MLLRPNFLVFVRNQLDDLPLVLHQLLDFLDPVGVFLEVRPGPVGRAYVRLGFLQVEEIGAGIQPNQLLFVGLQVGCLPSLHCQRFG